MTIHSVLQNDKYSYPSRKTTVVAGDKKENKQRTKKEGLENRKIMFCTNQNK